MTTNEIITDIMNEIIDNIDYQNDRKEAFDEVLRQLQKEWDDNNDIWQDEYTRYQNFGDVYEDDTDGCGNYMGNWNTDVFDISSNGTCDF